MSRLGVGPGLVTAELERALDGTYFEFLAMLASLTDAVRLQAAPPHLPNSGQSGDLEVRPGVAARI